MTIHNTAGFGGKGAGAGSGHADTSRVCPRGPGGAHSAGTSPWSSVRLECIVLYCIVISHWTRATCLHCALRQDRADTRGSYQRGRCQHRRQSHTGPGRRACTVRSARTTRTHAARISVAAASTGALPPEASVDEPVPGAESAVTRHAAAPHGGALTGPQRGCLVLYCIVLYC